MKLAATLAALLISGTVTPGHPATTVSQCPPGQAAATCVKGTVVFWEDPSSPAMNQFIQEDNSGAPQFSIGVGGAASYANPFCVTNNPRFDPPIRFLACIGGPWANGMGQPLVTLYDSQGRPVSLTIGDIRFLHRLEATGVRYWRLP